MIRAHYDGISYLTDDSSFAWHINNGCSEPYVPNELSVVNRFIELYPERKRTYIDVGAHIGTTVIPYSRIFNKVYAYEPNSKSFEFLETNLKLNNINNVIKENVAVSCELTTGELIKHGDNSGCYFFNKTTTGSIKTKMLDNELIEDIDFIKVDTEGSELLVLKSAEALLKKYEPLIQVEVNDSSENFFGIKKSELHDYLIGLNYKIFDDSCIDNLFYYVPK